MGKSLLDIIAENERLRIEQKNLSVPTDDVQKSPYREYAKGFGEFASQNYTSDSNFEAPNVNDVGDRALQDLKDLNVFPQDVYERVSTDLNDASVIDMPELDDISEDIYRNNLVYNKFVTFDYIPYEFQPAQGVNPQIEDYGSYIAEIRQNLDIRGFTLADIFLGNYNENDSPIGVIGGQALNVALNENFNDNLKRETLGRINTQAFSVLQTGELFRQDYDITVRRTPLARTAEFLTELTGFEFPFSYLPQDIFGFERVERENSDGTVTYIGSSLNFKERLALILQYTGKGQQTQLINLLKLNRYKPEVIGKFETLEANEYIVDYELRVGNPNANDFIVTFTNSIDSGRGAYEPYGVVGITKRTNTGSLVSDKFAWRWMEDVGNPQAIGWVDTGSNNRFNPKSLLFKTQDIINGFSEGEVAAFLDMSDKEFVEVVNGETNIISRGDATTASGDYVDDDGTQINKGEYFRVWTKQRGYNRLSRTLRHRALDNGDTRSVLNDNGLINFAPTLRDQNGDGVFDQKIKRYMFSLENLAWNDFMDDLPLCEQGVGDPVTGTRGRVMWFPPYNLKIDESVDVNWTTTEFIGRGEPMFTYNNTVRSATLSFSILVDHPDIVHRLVGEKTEFWERYFKGDKLIENEARALQFLNKRLSQNEVDEINKRRNIIQPPEKNNDKPNITPAKKEEEEKKKTNEEVNDNSLGEIALSVFFPNNDTNVPLPPVQFSLDGEDNNFNVRTDLNLVQLQARNYGYEGGQQINAIDFVSTDGYIIENKTGSVDGGLKYKKRNPDGTISATSENGIYTYNDGKLINNRFLCASIPNPPRGYKDRNNFGLNVPFFFEWKPTFLQLLKGAKKAEITFIGNASAAIPPTNTTNGRLSLGRAENTEEWFNKNVKVLLENLGEDVEITTLVKFQGDLEDIQKREQFDAIVEQGLIPEAGLNFCQDCFEADTIQCKSSRRVDIFVKILEEDDPEPEPTPTPTGDTTIVDDEGNEDLGQDADETTNDPDNPQDIPPIDPNILKKLVYTECDFFQYLEINEPIAYQTISERIKYFWPAYHSITPQGFNSRLTFLHQCTRQADSIGRDGVDNWKNLAFGRPPVCILRIGDFYHTRIIIESMSIDFDDQATWDLNPEGIGIQPMFANISLNIKILGGSSMTAPINRLQNALSFNYYANTEMYDGRADSVVFGDKDVVREDGSVDQTATFGTLKNGRIVDGIRLSSITNFTESQRQQRLATLRQQSRIILQNSTTAQASTEQISSLGEVESLLELKKNLGLALTEQEKKTQAISESTSDKFKSESVTQQTEEEVVNSIKVSLFDDQSALTVSAEELLERGEETDRTVYYDIVDQFLSASVTNPEDLNQDYIQQVGDDYITTLEELSIYFDNRANER
jgi:hypothetical protein